MRIHEIFRSGPECDYGPGGFCVGEHRYNCRRCGRSFSVMEEDSVIVGAELWPFEDEECFKLALADEDKLASALESRLAGKEVKNA